MEIIKIHASRKSRVREIVTLINPPTSGTLGDYHLLKRHYRRQDLTRMSKYETKWRQMKFNNQFVDYMEECFGELHCEYCGKKDLIRYEWYQSDGRKNDSATADHFFPKSRFPEMAENPENLFVACYRCNRRKGAKCFAKSATEFRYDDKIRKAFTFNLETVGTPWVRV